MKRTRKAAGAGRQAQTTAASSEQDAETGNVGATDTRLPAKADASGGQTDPDQEQGLEKSVLDVLAEGVAHSWALLHTGIVEFMACKDELLKHSLPPALLLRVVLSTSKIFRLFSDSNTPVLELLRLVKLYSADWEQQSVALKKLHADNESKQRQLNIALRRIEMTAMEQQRMAKERRVMNWERLFAKLNNRQSHGRRWKFTIQSFKDKLREGKFIAETYAPSRSDSENEDGDDGGSVGTGRGRGRHLSRLRLSSREGSLDVSSISLDNTNNASEEDKASVAAPTSGTNVTSPPSPTSDGQERDSARQSRTRLQTTDDGGESNARGDYDEDDIDSDEALDMFDGDHGPRHPRSSRQAASAQSTAMQSRHSQADATAGHVQSRPAVETQDAGVSTYEPNFKRGIGVRVFPPKDLRGVPMAAITVSIGDQVFDTDVFNLQQVDSSHSHEEFFFRLPPDVTDDMLTASQSASQLSTSGRAGDVGMPAADEATGEAGGLTLNIVLHSKSAQGPIIAMTTVPLRVLLTGSKAFHIRIPPSDDMVDVLDEGPSIQRLAFTDTVALDRTTPADYTLRPMAGGTVSQLPLVAYQIKMEIPASLQRGTETLSLEELIADTADELGYVSKEQASEMVRVRVEELRDSFLANDEAQRSVAEQMQEQHSNEIRSLAVVHAEELIHYQEEYETKIEELSSSLAAVQDRLEQNKDSMADTATQTSGQCTPEFSRSTAAIVDHSALPVSFQFDTPPPNPLHGNRHYYTKAMRKRSSKVSHPMPLDWMQNLPKDFQERLEYFTETSFERQRQLVSRVTQQVSSILMQQMAAQSRLAKPSSTSEICLPALFLPANRPNVIYSAKAHSYFHPPGAKTGRITQPPSILKLPAIPAKPRDAPKISTVNLFDLSQRFVSGGPYWWKDGDGKSPSLANAANPPPSMIHLRDMASPASAVGREEPAAAAATTAGESERIETPERRAPSSS